MFNTINSPLTKLKNWFQNSRWVPKFNYDTPVIEVLLGSKLPSGISGWLLILAGMLHQPLFNLDRANGSQLDIDDPARMPLWSALRPVLIGNVCIR